METSEWIIEPTNIVAETREKKQPKTGTYDCIVVYYRNFRGEEREKIHFDDTNQSGEPGPVKSMLNKLYRLIGKKVLLRVERGTSDDFWEWAGVEEATPEDIARIDAERKKNQSKGRGGREERNENLIACEVIIKEASSIVQGEASSRLSLLHGQDKPPAESDAVLVDVDRMESITTRLLALVQPYMVLKSGSTAPPQNTQEKRPETPQTDSSTTAGYRDEDIPF